MAVTGTRARCFHGWTSCAYCGPQTRPPTRPVLCPACGRKLRRISGGTPDHVLCPACNRRGFRALRLFKLSRP